MPGAGLEVRFPEQLDKLFGNKANYTGCKGQKHDKGAEFSGLGFSGKLPNDEHHIAHHYNKADVQGYGFKLFNGHHSYPG